MADKKQSKCTAQDPKREESVTLGSEPLFPNDSFELSTGAYSFIWEHERRINDETLHFLSNAFKGFRDEVQDEMVECLRAYFEECGSEGNYYLPLFGIEHIDMLLHQIVYKIEHGQRIR